MASAPATTVADPLSAFADYLVRVAQALAAAKAGQIDHTDEVLHLEIDLEVKYAGQEIADGDTAQPASATNTGWVLVTMTLPQDMVFRVGQLAQQIAGGRYGAPMQVGAGRLKFRFRPAE